VADSILEGKAQNSTTPDEFVEVAEAVEEGAAEA